MEKAKENLNMLERQSMVSQMCEAKAANSKGDANVSSKYVYSIYINYMSYILIYGICSGICSESVADGI